MRRHPYIIATVVATLLAVVVWLCIPKEYQASAKIVDEYKEIDLAIALNATEVKLRNSLGMGDQGLNNIETYCQVLKSSDFALTISKVQVPGKGMTYGEYVGREDTLAVISERIEYNLYRKTSSLTIGFRDQDALVAAQMLDSVIVALQEFVTSYRHGIDSIEYAKSKALLKQAEENYHEAQRAYTRFADSHQKSLSVAEKQQEIALQKDMKLCHDYYKYMLTRRIRYQSLINRPYTSFAVIQAPTVPREYREFLASYLLSFVFIALAAVKGHRLFRQRMQDASRLDFGGIFAPWNLSILVWLGIMILYLFYGDELYPLTSRFYISIALWLPLLVITSFVTYNLMEHRYVPYRPIEINNTVFYVLFFLSICLSPMYMYKVWQTVSMFDSKDMMNNVRLLSVHGDGMGSLYYALVLAPSLLLVSLWRYPKIPLWQVVVVIICCIINSLAIMEKGTFFLVVLALLYVLYERRVIRLRTIGFAMAIMLVLFFLFNLMRSGEDSDYSKEETLLGFIMMYVMSPPVAYCTVVEDISNNFGANSLTIPYALLERFNIAHFTMVDKLQEFVFVPVTTNVYTIMQPFYRDFGYMGVAFFAWLYGIVSGMLYRLSRNGNAFGICLYTYFVNVLILQFYQENLCISGMYPVLLTLCVYLCTQSKFSFSIGRNQNHQVTC